MFLSEPPRTQADIHFGLFGVPVRIHPMFWLMTLVLGPYNEPPIHSVIWLLAVLAAIVVHELGHALVMRMKGFWPAIVLHGFGGLAIPYGSGRSDRASRIAISAAGPAAGFLLAAVLFLILRFFGGDDVRTGLAPILRVPILPIALIDGRPLLTDFVNNIFYISVLWGLVNLLPIYPLDGGHIAQEALTWANPRDGLRQSLLVSTVTAGAMVAVAVLQWHSMFTALFFGYLAFSSYQTLQAYR